MGSPSSAFSSASSLDTISNDASAAASIFWRMSSSSSAYTSDDDDDSTDASSSSSAGAGPKVAGVPEALWTLRVLKTPLSDASPSVRPMDGRLLGDASVVADDGPSLAERGRPMVASPVVQKEGGGHRKEEAR